MPGDRPVSVTPRQVVAARAVLAVAGAEPYDTEDMWKARVVLSRAMGLSDHVLQPTSAVTAAQHIIDAADSGHDQEDT